MCCIRILALRVDSLHGGVSNISSYLTSSHAFVVLLLCGVAGESETVTGTGGGHVAAAEAAVGVEAGAGTARAGADLLCALQHPQRYCTSYLRHNGSA